MDQAGSGAPKAISAEELAEFNGTEGKAAYVAVEGKIYDVSKSALWRTGVHMNRHHSGRDLTTDIGAAPHGRDVLERYPQVATLQQGAPEELKHLPPFVRNVLESYPMAKRHPHPIVVHYPIALLTASALFLILHLVRGEGSFGATSFSLLVLGAFASLFGIATGLLTWWVNYQLRLTPLIRRKIVLSVILLFVETGAIVWRLWTHGLSIQESHPVYVLLVLVLTPIVGLLGYYGGQMTFPAEKVSRAPR